jgi:SpoVK/Ycf46/Vps4 family AAA+-type ATPase
MPTGSQLKALLKSLEEGDEDRLYSVGLQMAAHEARLGHGKLAAELRQLLDAIRARHRIVDERPPIPLAQPRGELAGILSVSYPEIRLEDMILTEEVADRLRRLLHEQRQQSRLRSYGLHPRSKLLLTGPPGSGKTLTAKALSGELKLPLFTIMLDGLITRFMGETSAKLRLVFDAMKKSAGVYLFDEFDAIGGQRRFGNDVGEVRRILNSFLSMLEEGDPSAVIVAATNHPELLDHALFRRFDDVLEYGVPSRTLVERTLRSRFSELDTTEVDWVAVAAEAEGSSYADITKACEDAAKEAILTESHAVTTDMLRRAIMDRKRASETRQG